MENVEKTKKSKSLIIVILLLVAVLIVGGILAYNIILCKPKNVFVKNINAEYKKISSLFEQKDEINNMALDMDLDFDIKINELLKSGFTEEQLQLIEEVNALNFKVESKFDLDKKLLSLVMDTRYNNASLLNVAAYKKSDSVYIKFKDLYDKYIEVPIGKYDELVESASIDSKDVEYIITRIKDAVLNNLNEEQFKKSNEKISINGEDVKATKITYILTEKDAIDITIKAIKELKDDNKFLEIISKASNVPVSELKLAIDEMVEEFISATKGSYSNEKIEISMYTKGLTNKAIMYTIKEDDLVINYSNYKDSIKFEIKDEDETYLTLTSKKEDDSYKTKIAMDKIDIIIDYKKEKETIKIDYELIENESKVSIGGKLVINTKEVKKDKEYNEDLEFTAAVKMGGIELAGIEIKSKVNAKYNEEVIIPDVSNSILYTNLTDDDVNTILNNLMSNQTLIDFVMKLSQLTNTDDIYDELI